MIKTFRHKGLEIFFKKGRKEGIQPRHAAKLARQSIRLNVAKDASYMKMPGWDLDPLAAKLTGHYSVSVNSNWRMTFKFAGGDAVLVDYQDYH